MYRRDFLKQGAAAVAVSSLPAYAGQLMDVRKRVGLIGTGWYGKADLLRLIQVAPVEVVSLCDVDSRMLAEAADMVATRQASKKTPRTYGDYREMLTEKDLDIVLIATPDHWHALPMIEAVEGGRRRLRPEADQRGRRRRPGDARRGAQVQARRAGRHAAPQHAAPRRSARPRDPRGQARQDRRSSRSTATTTCARRENPPDTAPPANLDYEMWTGPAPMRPYNSLVHPRSWRAFMEYGNGIVGDMCVHMLDMVRWMMDLGMPTRISSTGGILVDKESKANITDTQTATFDFGDLQVVWTHRTWGDAARSEVSVGRDVLRRQGHAQGQRDELRLHSARQGRHADPQGRDATSSSSSRRTRPRRTWRRHVAPAIRGHMKDFLDAASRRAASRWRTSSRATSRRPPASSPTCRCSSAARSSGITRRARWSGTPRPTGCCGGRIARRGCTRSLRKV